MILYVRTSDKVLLRFCDLETLRTWIEARRVSSDDEYLATDQTWQPLNRLFRIDLPPPGFRPADSRTASARVRGPAEPAPDPEQVPTVPFFPEALAPRGQAPEAPSVREGPTRVSSPAPTRDEARLHPVVEEDLSPAPDLWGSEPDAGSRRSPRKATWVALVAGVVCAGVAVAWLVSERSSPVEETVPVARSVPGSPAPATLPVTPPVSDSRSDAPGPPVPETLPSAPSPPKPPAPQGAAIAGSPGDTVPEGTPVPPAPAVAPRPAAPESPPAPPTATPPERPAPTRPEQGPPLAVARGSEDVGYDQHMAEGTRWMSRDPRKAFAHFQAASRERPGSVEPRVKMAECEYRLGRHREAAALFQQAMDANPNYGPAIAGLARTRARLGNDKDARYLYMKYLDVNPNGSHAAEARAYLGR